MVVHFDQANYFGCSSLTTHHRYGQRPPMNKSQTARLTGREAHQLVKLGHQSDRTLRAGVDPTQYGRETLIAAWLTQ